MRLCASLFRRRRGPAGLRDLFRFCRNYGLYILCSGLSACMGQGWYHYPQCALCAVEIPDGRLSKRLICRFLRSGGRSSPHDSYFLANTQNFLLAVPVANAFALWYDKFSKLEYLQVALPISLKWLLALPYTLPLHGRQANNPRQIVRLAAQFHIRCYIPGPVPYPNELLCDLRMGRLQQFHL